jgi:transcriptional regulator with XRE-family HTH domain
MSRPPKPPPYGVLIEDAREAAGLSRREAARRAGYSDAWWRAIVSGWQGSGPVTGTAETVAAMARVAGVDPGRLAGEGGRPDAAEILRSEPAAPPPARPAAAGEPDTAAKLFPGDTVKAAIWRLPASEAERAELIATVDRLRAGEQPDEQTA